MSKNDRIKIARERKGLSQQDLADLLGVKQPYITALEKDKGFSMKVAKNIAQHLDVSAEWIMYGDDAGDNQIITLEDKRLLEEMIALKDENTRLLKKIVDLQDKLLDKSPQTNPNIKNDPVQG